jgi:hypothetical protein
MERGAVYPTRPERLHLMLALGALVLLIAQQFFDLPGSGRVVGGLQNSLHGPWFALVTWVVVITIARWTRGVATILVAAMIAVILAIGTEALQKITGGDPEWSDVGFDLIGAAAALVFRAARKSLIPKRPGFVGASLLLLATLTPLLHALAVEDHRRSIAPDLIRFGSPLNDALFRANSPVEVVPAPAGWSVGARVLKITLGKQRWPGVYFEEPIADWRPYAALAVDVYVDGSQPLPITISVRLDAAPVDHVYRTFECTPGPCALTLPLAGLFDRDVARVNAVVIYASRYDAGRVVYLGRVALRK